MKSDQFFEEHACDGFAWIPDDDLAILHFKAVWVIESA
jgi:hypothetical protein